MYKTCVLNLVLVGGLVFLFGGNNIIIRAQYTTTVAPDTTTARPDTTTLAPDTTTARPDTTTLAPDTTTASPDTTTVAPDTTTARPDTTTVAPDTTTARPDTTTEYYTTTASKATTTAAPPATFCCNFENGYCSFDLNNWMWSGYESTSSIPFYDGQYVWTNYYNAELTSAKQSSVDFYTRFVVTYYVSSNDVGIKVYFQKSDGFRYDVDSLNYTGGHWAKAVFEDVHYCGEYNDPCEGQLVFVATSYGGDHSFSVAIDDANRDDVCPSSLPCCDFNSEDYDLCGFDSMGSQSFWKSYPYYQPSYPPPYPGSYYVFVETVGYSGSQSYEVTLRSELTLTISSDAVFSANLFAKPGSSDQNALLFNFVNNDTGEPFTLGYASDTSDSWITQLFRCTSSHGDCCQGYSECSGHIEIVAHIDANGGTVFYGIDKFYTSDVCLDFN